MKNTKDGYPLYLTVDLAKLYPGRSNPAEHNIVGAGYIIFLLLTTKMWL